MFARTLVALIALPLFGIAMASPDSEAHGPSQMIADQIRAAAGSDAAWVPAGMLKESFSPNDLATLVQFPSEEIAVVSLKGSQVRAALEKAISIYPASSSAFLQVSGLDVVFSKSAPPEKRIVSVTIAGGKLDDGRTYSVAMPLTLARGGYGYFKVWDKNQITKTLENTTLESLLKGKRAVDSAPRWIGQ